MDLDRLASALDGLEGTLLRNEPMAKHTTFCAGGPADLLFLPASEEAAAISLRTAREEDIPCMVMGAGSNLAVPSAGIRGLVIAMADGFSRVEQRGTVITAQAGAKLTRLARRAAEASLTGLEFASGIPGSAGGGTAMNAGAYEGQLSDVFERARVLIDGRIEDITLSEMDYGYRHSMPLEKGAVVLTASFRLRPGDREAIEDTMRDMNRRRREKQPLEYPSAGSVFKRPSGNYAGALIEQAGLKGLSIGGARVSEKHAGFIINTGNASGDDIIALIELVRQKVYEHSGVLLEREVRIPGVDAL